MAFGSCFRHARCHLNLGEGTVLLFDDGFEHVLAEVGKPDV